MILITGISIVVGLLSTLLLGMGVYRILESAAISIPYPRDPQDHQLTDDGKKLKVAIELDESLKYPEKILGILEQILSFASFWLLKPEFIGAWLVFKVGSKWAAWQHIMRIPKTLTKNKNPIDDLHIRNAWGTRTVLRFLLGSLYNILCGLGGTAVGMVCYKFLVATKSCLVKLLC